MAVKVKKKKKIFQVAKELNLATETIKEFLEKKGFSVTNPNTRIPEEYYDMLLQRFSHEKKVAEKIHKRREERNREEQEAPPVVEAPEMNGAEEAAPVVEPEPEETLEIVEEVIEEVAPVEEETSEIVEVEEDSADTVEEETEEVEEPVEDIVEALVEDETPDVEEVLEEVEEAEVETEEVEEAEVEIEEAAEPEPLEEKPQVGDIIDHPMAREYLLRQQREEEAKKERQRQTLLRLKQAEEKEEKTRKPKKSTKTETTPAGDAAAAPAEDAQDRKRGKKKDRKSKTEEKDARRKKAYEMIKRDRGRIRPDAVPADGEDNVVKEGRRRRKKKKEVDEKAVEGSLKETLAKMRDAGTGVAKKKRKKVKTEEGEEIIETNVVKVTEFITTQDLANLLDVPVTDVIRKCLELGLVVTINQRLDMDTIKLLAEEFGFEVEEEKEFGSEYLEEETEEEEDPANMKPRPPVVTIMGHVDHGKTSLLDYIRDANVVGGESGGITQHIGAYEVTLKDGRQITFLDTPGHEAFTAMRARGAQVTDIVVLVIAADDRVMPQTEEALDHAKAAGVSIVIALNKVDKPNANPEAIRKQLADRNVLVEDWGGSYQSVEVSAKTGHNVDELMEKILLEAELLELKANPDKLARGVVLEALLDKGKGSVATAMVQSGTLSIGDNFVIGQHSGRVRAMLNERGKRVKTAGPSTPVQILGINGVPEAGDRLIVMEDEKTARDIAQRRQQLKREQDFRQIRLVTLDQLSKQIKAGEVKELKLIVKADVDGSTQALTDSLLRQSTDTVEVQVIRRAVGPIAESDVILAAASQAIIIGFHVRPTAKAKILAEQEKVDIRQYKVIYDAIEDVQKALEGMLEPIAREVVLGTAEIRQVFKISRIGSIGGSYVLSGKITRNAKVRLIRNDVELYDGKLSSLKRFKDDVREVATSYECGIGIDGYNDIKEGDIVEAYEVVMEAQTLKK